MLHASIRAVGAIAGGPDQIHLALKDALTADGTLIMYASCPAHTDEIGRGESDRFVAADGRILLLGCDHDNVTFLHYAEHILDVADKRVAKFKVPADQQGRRVWREMEEFDTSGDGAHPNWPDRFFARLVDSYLRQTGNTGGLVGDARAFVLSARGLLDFSLPVMQAVAADASAASRLCASG